MGQSNELENPDLILDKLKGITFAEDEKCSTLDASFHDINLILNDYKYLANIINSQTIIPLKKINSLRMQIKKSREISKNEIEKVNKQYNKQIVIGVLHSIERIKKWIKMTKSQSKKYQKKKKKASIGYIRDSFPFNIDNDNDNKKRISSQCIERYKKLSAPVIEPMVPDYEALENNNTFFKGIKTTKSRKIILSKFTDKKIEMGINEFFVCQKSKFISRLIKGPPDCFRWTAWCVVNYLPSYRNLETYQKFLYKELETENKNRIIRDIQRTFNFGKIERKKLRKRETSLYNVLKAFWNIDKEVGYCQGMNLIAGFMLIVSDFNERDTFYLLLSYFSEVFKTRQKYEYNFRGLFSEEFPLLYHLNFVFDKLLNQHIPQLKQYMDKIGLTNDLWVGQWIQTAFTIILPVKWCKRVWDNIFATNIYFLVKFAVAFCKVIKDDLLKKDDQELMIYFKDLKNNSLSDDSEFLDSKTDINILIIEANRIKLQPEDYIKMYQKTEEGKCFVEKMENLQEANLDYTFVENTRLSFVEVSRQKTKLFDELSEDEEEEEDKVTCLSDDNENNVNLEYIKNNLINKNEIDDIDYRKLSKYQKRRRTRYTIVKKGLLNKHKMYFENDEESDKKKNKLRNIDNNDEDAFRNENKEEKKIDIKILRNSVASSNSNMEKEMKKHLTEDIDLTEKNIPDKILVSSLKGKNNNSENNSDPNKQEKKLDVKFNIPKKNEKKE